MFEFSRASASIDDFRHRVAHNVRRLEEETGQSEFAMPVGIFLVLGREHGGDDSGEEIIRRFQLIDIESRDAIDFFFLGWKQTGHDPRKAVFDLDAFGECRAALKSAGVSCFGGYANLILLDVWLRHGEIVLDFSNAINIDFALEIAEKRMANIGSFLESLFEVVAQLRRDVPGMSPTAQLSDRLGLVIAKHSILTYFLTKLGKAIGGDKLATLATRKLGEPLPLSEMRT